VAQLTGIAQKYPDLAVLHFAGRPAVLASDTDRVATFFEKAGLVEHQNSQN
jgi:hypothetical protein